MVTPNNTRRRRTLFIVLAILAFAASAFFWGPPVWRFLSDRAGIEAFLHSLGPWGPIGLIAVQTLQVFLLPIPGFFGLLGGFLYGFWAGLLYTQIGTVLGSMIAFFLARWFGRPLVARMVKPDQLARVDALIRNRGPFFFLLYFWAPYLPKDAMCYVAGLTPISPFRFLLACFFGRLLGSVGATLVGAGVWQIQIPTWGWVFIGAVVVLLLFLAARYRHPLRRWVLRLMVGSAPSATSTSLDKGSMEVQDSPSQVFTATGRGQEHRSVLNSYPFHRHRKRGFEMKTFWEILGVVFTVIALAGFIVTVIILVQNYEQVGGFQGLLQNLAVPATLVAGMAVLWAIRYQVGERQARETEVVAIAESAPAVWSGDRAVDELAQIESKEVIGETYRELRPEEGGEVVRESEENITTRIQ
jgi:uncharacterized membrane protein YdjX (TVP38/TMEM64 family)